MLSSSSSPLSTQVNILVLPKNKQEKKYNKRKEKKDAIKTE
jgi:hypothetical protein